MTTQAMLPEPQTAYNNLFTGIHQRIFFQKCAAAGFSYENEDQARWMLETAGKLRTAEQQMPKAASDQSHPYYQANQYLDQVLHQNGLAGPMYQQQAQEQQLAIKQAAYEAASDPVFYNSVLALKAAEAAQIQAELAQLEQR